MNLKNLPNEIINKIYLFLDMTSKISLVCYMGNQDWIYKNILNEYLYELNRNKKLLKELRENCSDCLEELRENCSYCQARHDNMLIDDLCSNCCDHLMDYMGQCDECNYCCDHQYDSQQEDLDELRENCSDCQHRRENMSTDDLCSECSEHLMDYNNQCDECNYCESHQ